MTEFAEARKVAALLAAISEPTRLRVLWQLAKGPEHVGNLADIVDIRMVNMSHHLGVMRQAGVLEDEKDGRRVIYRLRPDIFTKGTTPDVLGVLTLGSFRVVLRAKPEGAVATTGATGKTRRKAAKK
jgi:DNA-binding transcriptional ArsR family regulator